MRRNKHALLELKHPETTDRQAGRPAPTPRLKELLQPLTPWSPCSAHNPEGRQGVLQSQQIHIPGSQATDLGKEGG